MKKTGFTLAEVLITLGIIGIIAAMTLPGVITNWQKKVTISKMKKFYSVMNQVLERSQADNGDFKDWNYANSKEFFDIYLKPYLVKVETPQYNIHVSGDFTGGVRFVFPDGTQAICSVLSNFTGNGGNVDAEIRNPVVIFYTHSKKYYNSFDDGFNGHRDRFYFVINKSGSLVPPMMARTREQNLDNCKNGRFSTTVDTNNGWVQCSTIIYKDGWEIRDDYPW